MRHQKAKKLGKGAVRTSFILGIYLVSGMAFGLTGTSQLSLESFYQKKGLNPAKLKFIGNLMVTSPSTSWNKAIQGPVNLGNLAIKSLSQPSADGIPYGIKLHAQSGQIQAEVCYGDQCRPSQELKVNAKGLSLVESFQWEFRVYGNICQDGDQCDLYIPSMSLTHLNRNKALRNIPKRMVVIDSGKDIYILNAETQEIWLESAKTEGFLFEGLGNLKAASISPAGLMILTGTDGAIIADFSRQQESIYRASSTGLQKLHAGFGQLTYSDVRSTLYFPAEEEKPYTFRGANQHGVFFDRVFALRQNDGSFQHTMMPDEESIVAVSDQHLMVLREGELSIRAIGRQMVKQVKAIPFQSKPNEQLKLMGGDAFVITKQGLYQLTNDGRKPTSLVFKDRSFTVGDRYVMTVKTLEEGCEWNLFSQHNKYANSFKKSLSGSCGTYQSFSENGNGAAMIMSDGLNLTINSIRPNS